MTTLRLAIDASGMRRGADDAVGALRRVGEEAGGAATRVDSLGAAGVRASTEFRGVSSALAAVGGTVSLGGRVNVLAREFNEVGAQAAFASSNLLVFGAGVLEVSRIAEDIRRLRLAQEIEGTAKASGLLATIWRANPLLLVASGITAAAAAMAFFTSNTRAAAKEMVDLAKARRDFEQITIDYRVRERIGLDVDPADKISQQIDRLAQISSQIQRSGEPLPLFQVAELTGRSPEDIASRAQFGGLQNVQSVVDNPLAPPRTVYTADTLLSSQRASAELESRARELAAEPDARKFFGPTDQEALQQAVFIREIREQLDGYNESIRTESELLRLSATEREQQVAILQAEAIARQAGLEVSDAQKQSIRDEIALQQQMLELRAIGEETGAAIGSAFFSIVNGANNARQAVAALIQEFARLAQQRIIGQFSQALGQAFVPSSRQGTPFDAPAGFNGPNPDPGFQG